MKRLFIISIVSFFSITFMWVGNSASDVYKYTDSEGIIYYSNTPTSDDYKLYIREKAPFSAKKKTKKPLIKTGTGFIITKNGHILTCYHVIKGANKIKITNAGKFYFAELIHYDPNNDLALLKINGSFPALAFSLKQSAKIGQEVFTVGYPNPEFQGIEVKYNKGVVNSLAGFQDNRMQYQVSIPVQPGNSGGPLLDKNGNILGVIVARLNAKVVFEKSGSLPQNVNYAIKHSYARSMIDKLPGISDKLIAPSTSDTNKIDRAIKSTVMVICYN